MAIKPEQIQKSPATIDQIEREIDSRLERASQSGQNVTIIPPDSFVHDDHFLQVRALYLHAGWKDVIYNHGTLTFIF